ncbi:MAG: FtsX-like permease family protein [Bacteroidota bacterium]
MLKNYFKIAWRNLGSNKVSSFINIGGLAVGMAVAMLIGLWIYDELTFDKYHKNYEHIAQVMQHQTFNGKTYSDQSIPFPLGDELRTHYGSNFKYLAMTSWEGEHILSMGNKKISESGFFTEPQCPRMLTLKMIKGNIDGLKDMNAVLLSASAAKALTGDADPINKVFKIDNKLDVKIAGVYEDLPYNTRFANLHFIAPWSLYVSSEKWIEYSKTKWGNNSFQLYAQIADNTNFAAVDKNIAHSKLDKVPAEDKKYKSNIYLHAMQDWHLRAHWENGVQTGGAIEYVWLFALVGGFVLLLACINFMNLSTARSEKRAKEVGIRKAVGSLRSQLIAQFYSESLLVVIFAFLLSVILVALVLPWFNDVSNKKMFIPWANPLFWLMGIGFALITGIVAGSYPALYLSSFSPVKVLKGTFRVGRFASVPRKVLVVLQFTISLALIIGTIIIYNQVQYSKNRPIGYSRVGLMEIEMKSPDFSGKLDLLRTELKNTGAIQEMAQSSSPVTAVWSNNGGFTWEGKDPGLDGDFATIWVTHDFGKTVGWQFQEGRDFSREFGTDSSGFVINEAAVRFMGIKDPLGKMIKWGDGPNAKSFKVIGIIKDMLMQSPYDPVKQTIYILNKENENWFVLKLNPNKSAGESIAKIGAVFQKEIPSAPFDYKFADNEFAAKFAAEERVGKLSTFFSVLAVFISCLGLFGLASFVAEQRTKEIGVRKVLGATVTNLWGLLSKDFVLLVIISCCIATPVAWWFMHNWLQKYDYHTSISGWVFVAAGAGTMIITLLTVSFQAIKAALANPVKSLRSE